MIQVSRRPSSEQSWTIMHTYNIRHNVLSSQDWYVVILKNRNFICMDLSNVCVVFPYTELQIYVSAQASHSLHVWQLMASLTWRYSTPGSLFSWAWPFSIWFMLCWDLQTLVHSGPAIMYLLYYVSIILEIDQFKSQVSLSKNLRCPMQHCSETCNYSVSDLFFRWYMVHRCDTNIDAEV